MNNTTNYTPQPLDTGHIKLPADVLVLIEVLAKNTHEVWAQQRLTEGWRYGAKRNDERKEHPCLMPYEDLPENEKKYDRNTAIETLKAVKLLGFSIEK